MRLKAWTDKVLNFARRAAADVGGNVVMLFGLAMQLVNSPFSLILGVGPFSSMSSAELSDFPVAWLVASYVAIWLLSLLCYPLVSVGKTLLYIDQRFRHEGRV